MPRPLIRKIDRQQANTLAISALLYLSSPLHLIYIRYYVTQVESGVGPSLWTA